MAWQTVDSGNYNGIAWTYQVEVEPIDSGAGEGNRHRLTEQGQVYAPAPQGRPCSSSNFIATSWDPFNVLDYAQQGLPVVLRVTRAN